jgi:hypothetical protein
MYRDRVAILVRIMTRTKARPMRGAFVSTPRAYICGETFNRIGSVCAMSVAIPANHGALWSLNKRRDRLLMELVLAGLLSIAAVRSCEVERRPCGPFTIGKSAIGGCDYIAGRERF